MTHTNRRKEKQKAFAHDIELQENPMKKNTPEWFSTFKTTWPNASQSQKTLYKQNTKKLKKSKTKNQTRQIKKNDHASTSSKTKK